MARNRRIFTEEASSRARATAPRNTVHTGSSSARASYRLIGYGDRHTYRPVNFDSLDELLSVLKTALPEFDASSIPQGKQPETSILFANVMELSDAQLLSLGFRE